MSAELISVLVAVLAIRSRASGLTRPSRCAPALRVTAPLGYGSRRLVGPKKVPFRPYHTARTPLFPHKQPSLRIGPQQSRARSGGANP